MGASLWNRCLLLEDLTEAQEWLSSAIAAAFPGVRVDVAGSLAQARAQFDTSTPPDLAVVDLGLPDGDGTEFIAELSYRSPRTRIIVASLFDDDAHIFPALRAGAHGYLLKDQAQASMAELLRGVTAGNPPLSPAVARKILSHFKAPIESAAPQLTERESQVLRLIAKGLTTPEVARILEISANTVPSYVKEIYRKLNISSRAEAAVSARNLGLV